MKAKPIRPERIRKITGSFGWIEHRFVREGFLESLHATESLLYFFLSTVADRNGVSYYRQDTIRYLLRIPYEHSLTAAVAELVDRDLIAYSNGIYQVLSLPLKKPKGAHK